MKATLGGAARCDTFSARTTCSNRRHGGSVRLADFIANNTEAILAEWVAFAASSGRAGATMDLDALRDHAKEMLKEIVADLRTPQTKTEQTEKSKGNSDTDATTPDTPAEVHRARRAASGFTRGEIVSAH